MQTTKHNVLDPDDLSDTDRRLLDELQGGRVTPTFAADKIGVTREYASDRLKRFLEHGIVEKVAPALYELRIDPRSDNGEGAEGE